MFGFPSQIEDDPVLRLVVSHDDSYNYAEERRLFYVALTRTKNRVFIITPENRPSEFIKELLIEKKLYPNVVLNGNLNLESKRKIKNVCPIFNMASLDRPCTVINPVFFPSASIFNE